MVSGYAGESAGMTLADYGSGRNESPTGFLGVEEMDFPLPAEKRKRSPCSQSTPGIQEFKRWAKERLLANREAIEAVIREAKELFPASNEGERRLLSILEKVKRNGRRLKDREDYLTLLNRAFRKSNPTADLWVGARTAD